LYALILSGGSGAREGFCDEGAFEFWREGKFGRGRDAGRDCEGVDELEDEESGESTA